jgi:hypothetical protein
VRSIGRRSPVPDRLPPPSNAAEASARIDELEHQMEQDRDRAHRLGLLAADLGKAYGDAFEWAILQVDEPNAERRKAAANQTPVLPDLADRVAGWLVKHEWLAGFRPERTRDLKWLMERTATESSSLDAKAYDRRAAMGGRSVVGSWAKQEAAMTGEVSP